MPLRPARVEDQPAIITLLAQSFETTAEASLVEAINRGGYDPVSIVHESDGAVDGYCLMSQMRSPADCLGLGPIAVAAQHRKAGLGAKMVREAINRAVSNGWRAIFVLGDPAYYRRFGFSVDKAARFETDYPKEYFQILELEDGAAETLPPKVLYAEAFDALT